jgi:hypothetical protein
MDTEDSELFSFNYLTPPYLGKPKKGTSFNQNHECNTLVVLIIEMFGPAYIGPVGNSLKLCAFSGY